ncbi:MAG: type II secretion system protein GspG [Myxococcota bacterium]|nr:type II secretion system protein GspG [Myxococcota bacterium]
MPANRDVPKVFFPWEKRRGMRSLFARARARQAMILVLGLVAALLLRRRDEHVSDVRATRATITQTINAIAAWRADHDRGCPGSLVDLVSGGYLHRVPRDAWGGALRVTCPGRRDPQGFDVASDGPDGELGGRDRVE